MLNLLFFVLLLAVVGCRFEPNHPKIIFKEGKAVAVNIPEKMFSEVAPDSINKYVKIRLAHTDNASDILGEYKSDNGLLFTPLIPFSQGTDYEIRVMNQTAGHFSIPVADTTDKPKLIAAYPTQDTLPENLLKIYLQFSHSMREGQSDRYIQLIKNGTDTLDDVFLNLQPELWNEDRTVLTVWLDPGRIKRALQPNIRLGNPLQKNTAYQLIVSAQWQDTQGRSLQKDFSKKWMAGIRDSLSPDPEQWKIAFPKALTREPLVLSFGEALDHYLLLETLHIITKEGIRIKGKFETGENDRSCRFIPAEEWAAGNYVLMIASRLEDLAGNNLNRPFDRDITKTQKPSTQDQYRKYFSIEK